MVEPAPAFAPLTRAQVRLVEDAPTTPECFISMARAATKLKSRMTNHAHDIVSLGLKLHLPDKYQRALSELPPVISSGYHFGQVIRVKPRQDNGHNYGRHTVMVVQLAGQSSGDSAIGITWFSNAHGGYLTFGNYLPECTPQDKNTPRAPYTNLTLQDFFESLPATNFSTQLYGDFGDPLRFLAKLCHHHYKL